MAKGNCVQRSLPNIITFMRLCAVPITLFFILKDQFRPAFYVFSGAALTDWADGFLARRWNVVSFFGQVLDPLADKSLIVLTTLLLGWKGYLPFWLVGLITCRDILLIAVGLYVYKYKIDFSLNPSFMSKINTVFQLLLLGFILFFDVSSSSAFILPYSSLYTLFFTGLVGLVTVTTVLSGVGYLKILIKKINREMS